MTTEIKIIVDSEGQSPETIGDYVSQCVKDQLVKHLASSKEEIKTSRSCSIESQSLKVDLRMGSR